jgi:hypothetical protein
MQEIIHQHKIKSALQGNFDLYFTFLKNYF